MNHSFSWKNNSPFYQKVTFYLAVHQLTGIWVALPFVLLGMMLLWSFKLKFFYARVFAAVLGGTAGSCGNSVLLFVGLSIFSTVVVLFHSRQQGLVFPQPQVHLLLPFW